MFSGIANSTSRMRTVYLTKHVKKVGDVTDFIKRQNLQYRSHVLTWIFHTRGSWTELLANSTPKTSTFFARSHLGFDGEESDQPEKPRPDIIIAASEIDHMK
jgi:hypothetical protein